MFVCVPKHSTAANTIILFKMIAEKIIFSKEITFINIIQNVSVIKMFL